LITFIGIDYSPDLVSLPGSDKVIMDVLQIDSSSTPYGAKHTMPFDPSNSSLTSPAGSTDALPEHIYQIRIRMRVGVVVYKRKSRWTNFIDCSDLYLPNFHQALSFSSASIRLLRGQMRLCLSIAGAQHAPSAEILPSIGNEQLLTSYNPLDGAEGNYSYLAHLLWVSHDIRRAVRIDKACPVAVPLSVNDNTADSFGRKTRELESVVGVVSPWVCRGKQLTKILTDPLPLFQDTPGTDKHAKAHILDLANFNQPMHPVKLPLIPKSHIAVY
jgi:hypothetical protein